MTFSTGKRLLFLYSNPPPMLRTGGKPTVRERMRRNPLYSQPYPLGIIFWDAIKGQYYPVGSYEDKYIQWTTLRKQRDQDVHELTNLFHTLCTKLGTKDSKKHLVLKYHGYLHKYIQEEMDFLDISSLGMAYRYATKIEQKFKQKKQDFGSSNQKQGKGSPKPQNQGHTQGMVTQYNLPNTQANRNTAKPKKEVGKWCEFH